MAKSMCAAICIRWCNALSRADGQAAVYPARRRWLWPCNMCKRLRRRLAICAPMSRKPWCVWVDRLLAKKPLDRFGSPDEVLTRSGLIAAMAWRESIGPTRRSLCPTQSGQATARYRCGHAATTSPAQSPPRSWQQALVSVTAMSLLALLSLSLGGLVAQWRPRSTFVRQQRKHVLRRA